MPTVKSHDANLYYTVCGPENAPALVFAHGRGGNGSCWWQQVPYFSDRYRVVVFDHRAFGRSVCAPGKFLVRYFADDLAAILDAAGIKKASIVCQSMGGWTGLRFALAHPERVRCLVLGNTPGGVMTEKLYAHARSRPSTIENSAFNSFALAPDYHKRQPAMGYLYNQIGAFNTGDGPAGWSTLPKEERDLDPAKLKGYKTPTMMITGAEDRIFPPAMLHEVAPQIPGCAVVDMPGVGHSAYFEDAPAFNRTVDAFLTKHTKG
jgi:pimeloyl-ACP methyl ester carboxylesterase